METRNANRQRSVVVSATRFTNFQTLTTWRLSPSINVPLSNLVILSSPKTTTGQPSTMPSFTANDGVILHYSTFGSESNPPLILVRTSLLYPNHELTSPTAPRLHRLRRSLQAQHPRPLTTPLRPRARPSRPRSLRQAQSRLPRGQTGDGPEELHRPHAARRARLLGRRRRHRRKSGRCDPLVGTQDPPTDTHKTKPTQVSRSLTRFQTQVLRRTLHAPNLRPPNLRRPSAPAKLPLRLGPRLRQPRHERRHRARLPPTDPRRRPCRRAPRDDRLLLGVQIAPRGGRPGAGV